MSAAAAEQAKLRKRLEALLKLPENQMCCDCGKRGPRWASANLGNFFCIECSGIHRNLGVHISFVRSVNLDSWTQKQVEFMEQWGNARANAYWEANIPAHVHKPQPEDPVRVVERFIRDKYEHKKFVAAAIPPPVAARATEARVEQSQPSAVPKEDVRRAAPPVRAAPPAEINLLDFDAVPAGAPVSQSQPQQQPQTVFGFAPAAPPHQQFGSHSSDDFGEFNSHVQQHPHSAPVHRSPQIAPHAFDPFAAQQHHAPPAAPQQHLQQHHQQQAFAADPWGFSGPATGQQQTQPAPPARPQASADAILSLYNQPHGGGTRHHGGPMMGAPPPMQPGYPPMHGGVYPGHHHGGFHGAGPAGHGYPPPQQYPPQQYPPQQYPGYPAPQQYPPQHPPSNHGMVGYPPQAGQYGGQQYHGYH